MNNISRLAAAGIATAALAGCVGIGAQATTPTPAVFFVPHQDDEVLTMASNIEQEARAGRPVYVVLLTDGGSSNARTVLASKGYPLTRGQFVAARNAEFTAALGRLGVPASHITFTGIPDGTLTPAAAAAVINFWAVKYPGASLKTMSTHDAHPDHVALGKALGLVSSKDKRWLQFRRYWTTLPVPGFYVKGTTRTAQAAAEYGRWDPSHGRYGIGYISVAKDFKALASDPRSKVSTCP